MRRSLRLIGKSSSKMSDEESIQHGSASHECKSLLEIPETNKIQKVHLGSGDFQESRDSNMESIKEDYKLQLPEYIPCPSQIIPFLEESNGCHSDDGKVSCDSPEDVIIDKNFDELEADPPARGVAHKEEAFLENAMKEHNFAHGEDSSQNMTHPDEGCFAGEKESDGYLDGKMNIEVLNSVQISDENQCRSGIYLNHGHESVILDYGRGNDSCSITKENSVSVPKLFQSNERSDYNISTVSNRKDDLSTILQIGINNNINGTTESSLDVSSIKTNNHTATLEEDNVQVDSNGSSVQVCNITADCDEGQGRGDIKIQDCNYCNSSFPLSECDVSGNTYASVINYEPLLKDPITEGREYLSSKIRSNGNILHNRSNLGSDEGDRRNNSGYDDKYTRSSIDVCYDGAMDLFKGSPDRESIYERTTEKCVNLQDILPKRKDTSYRPIRAITGSSDFQSGQSGHLVGLNVQSRCYSKEKDSKHFSDVNVSYEQSNGLEINPVKYCSPGRYECSEWFHRNMYKKSCSQKEECGFPEDTLNNIQIPSQASNVRINQNIGQSRVGKQETVSFQPTISPKIIECLNQRQDTAPQFNTPLNNNKAYITKTEMSYDSALGQNILRKLTYSKDLEESRTQNGKIINENDSHRKFNETGFGKVTGLPLDKSELSYDLPVKETHKCAPVLSESKSILDFSKIHNFQKFTTAHQNQNISAATHNISFTGHIPSNVLPAALFRSTVTPRETINRKGAGDGNEQCCNLLDRNASRVTKMDQIKNTEKPICNETKDRFDKLKINNKDMVSKVEINEICDILPQNQRFPVYKRGIDTTSGNILNEYRNNKYYKTFPDKYNAVQSSCNFKDARINQNVVLPGFKGWNDIIAKAGCKGEFIKTSNDREWNKLNTYEFERMEDRHGDLNEKRTTVHENVVLQNQRMLFHTPQGSVQEQSNLKHHISGAQIWHQYRTADSEIKRYCDSQDEKRPLDIHHYRNINAPRIFYGANFTGGDDRNSHKKRFSFHENVHGEKSCMRIGSKISTEGKSNTFDNCSNVQKNSFLKQWLGEGTTIQDVSRGSKIVKTSDILCNEQESLPRPAYNIDTWSSARRNAFSGFDTADDIRKCPIILPDNNSTKSSQSVYSERYMLVHGPGVNFIKDGGRNSSETGKVNLNKKFDEVEEIMKQTNQNWISDTSKLGSSNSPRESLSEKSTRSPDEDGHERFTAKSLKQHPVKPVHQNIEDECYETQILKIQGQSSDCKETQTILSNYEISMDRSEFPRSSSQVLSSKTACDNPKLDKEQCVLRDTRNVIKPSKFQNDRTNDVYQDFVTIPEKDRERMENGNDISNYVDDSGCQMVKSTCSVALPLEQSRDPVPETRTDYVEPLNTLLCKVNFECLEWTIENLVKFGIVSDDEIPLHSDSEETDLKDINLHMPSISDLLPSSPPYADLMSANHLHYLHRVALKRMKSQEENIPSGEIKHKKNKKRVKKRDIFRSPNKHGMSKHSSKNKPTHSNVPAISTELKVGEELQLDHDFKTPLPSRSARKSHKRNKPLNNETYKKRDITPKKEPVQCEFQPLPINIPSGHIPRIYNPCIQTPPRIPFVDPWVRATPEYIWRSHLVPEAYPPPPVRPLGPLGLASWLRPPVSTILRPFPVAFAAVNPRLRTMPGIPPNSALGPSPFPTHSQFHGIHPSLFHQFRVPPPNVTIVGPHKIKLPKQKRKNLEEIVEGIKKVKTNK